MTILAIDPGTKQSGWVQYDPQLKRVHSCGISPNEHVLERIRVTGGYVMAKMIEPLTLAIERFEARGMPIGDESIETLIWTGRFMQAWHRPAEVWMVKRSAVKLHLCGTNRAKDPNVMQALLDCVGPKGTKKEPGPTFGVSSHAWAALGVAVTCAAWPQAKVAA